MRARRSWRGATDINAVSIGIELVNPGHEFGYRPFPARPDRRPDRAHRRDPRRAGPSPTSRSSATPTSPRTARRIPASSFPGRLWPRPATASGSSRRRRRARRWRRATEGAAVFALKPALASGSVTTSRHWPLRTSRRDRRSAPSSATGRRERVDGARRRRDPRPPDGPSEAAPHEQDEPPSRARRRSRLRVARLWRSAPLDDGRRRRRPRPFRRRRASSSFSTSIPSPILGRALRTPSPGRRSRRAAGPASALGDPRGGRRRLHRHLRLQRPRSSSAAAAAKSPMTSRRLGGAGG